MIYNVIEHFARYNENVRKNDIFNILFVYTIDDYLNCIDYKKSFFNDDQFYQWIINELLFHCNAWSSSRNVICFDNFNIHTNERMRETIETHDCLIRFLLFYSSNYNFIELTFDLLKKWMRKHWRSFKKLYRNDFIKFLRFVVEQNECDKKSYEYFKFNANDYIFENDMKTLKRELIF